MMLTALLPIACSACFFTGPRTTSPGSAPLTVSLTLPHPSRNTPQIYLQANSVGTFSQPEVPCSKMTPASVRLVTKLREEGKRQGKRGRDPRIIRCLLRHRLLISVSVLCKRGSHAGPRMTELSLDLSHHRKVISVLSQPRKCQAVSFWWVLIGSPLPLSSVNKGKQCTFYKGKTQSEQSLHFQPH